MNFKVSAKTQFGSLENFSFNSSTKLPSDKAGIGPMQNPQRYYFDDYQNIHPGQKLHVHRILSAGFKIWGRIIYFHVTQPSKILNQFFGIGFSRVFVLRSETDIEPNDCYWQPYGWPIVKKSVGITFKEMSIGSKEQM